MTSNVTTNATENSTNNTSSLDNSTGSSDPGETGDPIWFNFIVNEELESWAVIATWDFEFNTAFLYTPDDQVCVLTADWKSDDPNDNIWGFFVSEGEQGPCPFIEENNYTYAAYTYDEETQDPISLTGPWQNEWYFKSEEDFAEENP